MVTRRTPLSAVLAALVAASGCSYYRGMPSHGGGKRFDEEQRAVAAAVRRTISCLDLSDLAGKRTALVVKSLYTSGSGTTDWSGLQDASLGLGYALTDTRLERTTPPDVDWRDDTTSDRDSTNLNLRYRPNTSYRHASQHTEADLNYLRAVLEMKARHSGLSPVTQKPEVILHVLVDVLGTNHSRRDFIVYANETLMASCEVTYYAQDVKSGKLLFKARQVGSAARYSEGRVFFVPASVVRRRVYQAKPVYFCSGEVRPTMEAPVEIPENLGEVKRVSEQMTPEQREELLEALIDRARFSIESGNGPAAQEYLDTVRSIDPGYKGLVDLAKEVDRLDPNGAGQ
jgi:hypothetical protein